MERQIVNDEALAKLRQAWEEDNDGVFEFWIGDKLVVIKRGVYHTETQRAFDVLRYFMIGDKWEVSKDMQSVTFATAIEDVVEQWNAYQKTIFGQYATLHERHVAMQAEHQKRIEALTTAHTRELERRERYAATLAERLEATEAQLRLSSDALRFVKWIEERNADDDAVNFCPVQDGVVVFCVNGKGERYRLLDALPERSAKAPSAIEAAEALEEDRLADLEAAKVDA